MTEREFLAVVHRVPSAADRTTLCRYSDTRLAEQCDREDRVLYHVARTLLGAGQPFLWRAVYRRLVEEGEIEAPHGPGYRNGDEWALFEDLAACRPNG